MNWFRKIFNNSKARSTGNIKNDPSIQYHNDLLNPMHPISPFCAGCSRHSDNCPLNSDSSWLTYDDSNVQDEFSNDVFD